eukprot:GHVT01057727.1.p1 GENE.GHVT01057727.1~~GHVT01057727.1.p1  ORF type:complete len:123 (+),score=40.28 GHVT01057727.1:584-952(+)
MGAINGPCCAWCYLLLSAFAVVFLLVIGIMMTVAANCKGHDCTPAVEIPMDAQAHGAVAAFVAAGVYLAVLVVTSWYLFVRNRRVARSGVAAFALRPIGRGAENSGDGGGDVALLSSQTPDA